MTAIAPVLARLGLSQYTPEFVGEGFDTWETVLDITESDLDLLNVKLGHRRKLQREIANARGISLEQLVQTSTKRVSSEFHRYGDNVSGVTKTDSARSNAQRGKRKYRRHPKPDEHAPERPPSAYVIFSNKCREDLKPQSLSFTSIAKLVGERWQALATEEKEPFESHATSLKEKYNAELAKYRRTGNYKDYIEYLADFKAKNKLVGAGKDTKAKRPKTDTHSSAESEDAHSRHGSGNTGFGSHRPRFDSMESGALSPTLSMAPSFGFTGKPTSPASMSPMDFSPRPSPSGVRTVGPASASSVVDRISNWASDAPSGTALPRILPLDDRDDWIESAATPPLMTDPSVLRNPDPRYTKSRRPPHVPPPVLRNDTQSSISSSSRSSYLSSSGTGGSTWLSPNSPVEESSVQKGLPPLSSIASSGGNTINSGIGTGRSYLKHPTISQSFLTYNSTPPLSSDDGSSASRMYYNNNQVSSKQYLRANSGPAQSSPNFGFDAHGVFPDIPHQRRSLTKLSIVGTDPESPRDQWNSVPEFGASDYFLEHTASHLQNSHNASVQKWSMSASGQELQSTLISNPKQRKVIDQGDQSVDSYQSRPLDGLSVLALAGRMIDSDEHKPP
ncbi:hypothetical protein MMC13_006682 [Lambiella insularis]|nr:hypothetical protein [Lambiella insularis]